MECADIIMRIMKGNDYMFLNDTVIKTAENQDLIKTLVDMDEILSDPSTTQDAILTIKEYQAKIENEITSRIEKET